jgi:hypothetical protein
MTTDWARLRQVMYEPATCWLSTDYAGDRWLTDQYVLYNVTGYEELYCYDSSYDVVWPDGPYQVTVSKGFKPRKSVPQPDIEAYLAKMNDKSWLPASPTEWSVAEHPGKAMLWRFGALPCLLGESTWSAIKRHHPNVEVEYTSDGNIFRFRETCHLDPYDDCAGGDCPCEPVVFAYAAGIRCPDGQEDAAYEIARSAA